VTATATSRTAAPTTGPRRSPKRAGDAVLVMGGGRSYRIAELLLEHLAG